MRTRSAPAVLRCSAVARRNIGLWRGPRPLNTRPPGHLARSAPAVRAALRWRGDHLASAPERPHRTAAADLAAHGHRAALEGRWATTIRFLAGPRLLIIDEVGYLPPASDAAADSGHHPALPQHLDRADHEPRHRLLRTGSQATFGRAGTTMLG